MDPVEARTERAESGALSERRTPPLLSISANRDFVLRRLLVCADLAAIIGALIASTTFVAGGLPLDTLLWGLATLPGWIVLFKVYGLYDRDGKRVSHSTVDELPRLFHAVVIGGLGLWVVLRYSSAHQLHLLTGLTFFGIAFVGIAGFRAGARALFRQITSGERVLFVGGGPLAVLLARKLRQHPEYHLEPIGYVDGSDTSSDGAARGLSYLGELSEIDLVCRRHGVERVLILAPIVSPEEVADLIRELRDLDVRIGVLPHVMDVLGPSVEIDDVEGITVLGVSPPKLTRSSRFLKRAMDLTLGSVLLVLAFVPMLLIAVAIKLTSDGPVLYRQRRIGQGGRQFAMLKFRTMVQDAEQQEGKLRERSGHPAWLLVDHDPRITKVGRFLRHTSLDELPQLWNVIHGDMSLVGPRPLVPSVDEHISGWGRRRLDLTPGMTGVWQVLGRTNISFEEMVKLDYLYVTNWSLWEDVRLLIRTVPAVIRQRGVN